MRARPLLLAAPSALAGIGRGAARAVLVGVALLLLAALAAPAAPDPDLGAPGSGGSDAALYGGIVEAVRHGTDYYAATASALRAGDYPLRPFVAFRPPTLSTVSATLPPWTPPMLLAALALAVTLAWWERLAPALRGAPVKLAAALLLLAGVAASFQQPLWLFHEAWAGLFVALSLARWRPARPVEAIGWALAAALIRETAALYLLLMAAAAWRDGGRRETVGWLLATAVLALVVTAHAVAVARVVEPLDPSSPGWTGLLGPAFALRALAASTALAVVPVALAAPLCALGLVGWTAWRDPAAARTAATLAGYGLLLAVFARADNFYWALMLAPLSLAGLVFVPDMLRDLVRAALDRRRITVRRVAR